MAEKTPRTRGGHYSEEEWIDFARGLSASADVMERHLAACASCGTTAGFWRSVLTAASPTFADAPPDSALRQARAHYAFSPRPGLVARARAAASLIFDSLRQPLPAGVRAAGPSARKLVYKAGSYVVRLRVEPVRDSDRVSIVGQVVDDANPARPLVNLAIRALRGPDTIDRTLTNPLGEFYLEPEAADNLRLSVGVPDRAPLTVGLLVSTRDSRADARALGGPGRKTANARRSKTRPRR
jgi:hypothetical protein